jgi:hypothetical protein
MKVQLSVTIDAELSMKLSKRIKESQMSKSAYIQRLIENDVGLKKSVIPESIEVSQKLSKRRLVIDVIRTSKHDSITYPPIKFKINKEKIDAEYYYPFGKQETTHNAVSIATVFADDRLSNIRKTELEKILNRLMTVGSIMQPKKDYFQVV